MTSKQDQGKFAGWTNTNTNFGAVGDNSTGTIHLTKPKKTCKICRQEVGIDYQNNCQCEKKDGHCGYCEENEVSRRSCTCYKSEKKPEISSHSSSQKKQSEANTEPMEIDKESKIQISENLNPQKPTLLHLLGKGGYGEVYKGKWQLQDVAVKKLYLSLNNISESDRKSIEREIDILKNLRNRYVIQYYDTYSDSQELFIIMDYAENGTLTEFINDYADKEYNWDFNSNLIKQMTSGLAYIHQQGIIHRDLKSMNILLANGYQVKISDFGLSRTKSISSSQSKNTAGTVRWTAPEIIKGQKHSEQSDIYALGMIIWEIASKCTMPFKNIDNNWAVVYRIDKGEKETIPNDAPQNIRTIIQQCWKDNPQERINLEEMLEIIESNNSQTVHLLTLPNPQESKNDPYKFSQSVNLDLSGFSNLNLDSSVAFQSEQNLQQQIEVKKSELENLINSTKEKLKSHSKFSDAKKKERNERLESFFKNLPTAQDEFVKQLDNIKEGLSKKLTWQEINNLCQTSNELKQLNSQNQQQAQIIQQQPFGMPSSSK